MLDDLEALTVHVERGGDQQAVTLVVGGTILTGVVVSRASFLDEVRGFARAAQRASLLEHLGRLSSAPAERTGHVHLKEVTILLGTGRIEIEMVSMGRPTGTAPGLARVRLDGVHAWLPGHARLSLPPEFSIEQEGDDVGARIVHIAPAEPGWRAVYDVGEKARTLPIACWALVHERFDDDDGKGVVTYVAPIVPEVATYHPNGTIVGTFRGDFAGVAGPNQDPEDVRSSNAQIIASEAEEDVRLQRHDRSRAGKLLYLYATRAKPGQG